MPSQTARARGRPRAFNNSADRTIIQSLDRAMHLLKIVATGDGMSLTEIADAAGQPPSTAYRILITLQKHGVVDFEEAGQTWHVGLGAFRIGSAFLGRTAIVEQSRAEMQTLMQSTGETANLAIVDNGEVVFISQVETSDPIRAFFRPGTRGPIHASGIGKALLAYFPQAQADAAMTDNTLIAFTAQTITERDAMADELARIRTRGWSVDDEERTLGMRCIAAPIFNAFGEAVAGISVSGPSVRMTPDRDIEIGAMIRAAAERITRTTGGRWPAANAGGNQ